MASLTIKYEGTEDVVFEMVKKASLARRDWIRLMMSGEDKYCETCFFQEYVTTMQCLEMLVKETRQDICDFVMALDKEA